MGCCASAGLVNMNEAANSIEILTTRGKKIDIDKSLLKDEEKNINLSDLKTIVAHEIYMDEKEDILTLVQYNNKYILDISAGKQEITKTEMEWLVYGACFLASGGGGPLEMGLEFVKEMEQDTITLIKPQSVAANNSAIIVADLGSPQAVLNSKTLGRTAPLNCTKYMIEYAKKEHNSILSAVYPIEIGAANTIIPFFTASKLNLNVMDADISGRSVPYISDTLLAVNNIPCCPACIAKDSDAKNEDGDPVLFDNIKLTPTELNAAIVNEMKQKWKVDVCGLNVWLILKPSLPSFCDIINTFTIDMSIKLGRIFQSSLDGKHKIEQISQILAVKHKKMYNLFDGKLTFFETKNVGVIDLNRVVFTDNENKQEIAVYGLNENLIAFNLTTKKLQAMGPDGVAFLDKDNKYKPLDVTSIEKYKDKDVEFKILGIEAWDNLLKANFVNVMMKTVKNLSIVIQKIYPKDNLPVIQQYTSITKLQE